MNKKLYYLTLSLCVCSLLACNDIYLDKEIEYPTKNVTISKSSQKAIDFLNEFRNSISLSTDTRSSKDIEIKSIETQTYHFQLPINNEDIRNGVDSINIYTLTFKDNNKEGYAILSPDERVGRVYAYTENGQFTDTIKNKGLASHINNIKNICKDDLIIYYNSQRDAITRGSTYRDYIIPNFLNLKWDQDSPYNLKCPQICANNGHAVAGGTAIAVAQVLLYYKEYMPIGNTPFWEKEENKKLLFNWDLLTAQPQITDKSSNELKNEAAGFVYAVAELCKSKYACGGVVNGFTTAKLEDAALAFKKYLGWSYKSDPSQPGEELEYISGSIALIPKEKIRDALIQKNPILVHGNLQTVYAPHTWIYTGLKYTTRNASVASINEVYINWGFGGSSDGWFVPNKAANGYITQGFLFIDPLKSGDWWGVPDF